MNEQVTDTWPGEMDLFAMVRRESGSIFANVLDSH